MAALVIIGAVLLVVVIVVAVLVLGSGNTVDAGTMNEYAATAIL
jgi:hypothetical protein